MEIFVLKYWFEHGGTCLWSVNKNALDKYGYAITNEDLPISKDLIEELYSLENKYQGYLNWEYPPDPSPWSPEQKQDFIIRATIVYHKLLFELGEDYGIINDLESCVT
jgi:hypothetical protein